MPKPARDHLSAEAKLEHAAREGRCLVTRNGIDFVALTRTFREQGRPHAGVLILPRSWENHEVDRITRSLAWFDCLYPDGVQPYFIGYLEDPPPGWQPSKK